MSRYTRFGSDADQMLELMNNTQQALDAFLVGV